MNPIYHILGSDIPHHNHTVLHFFQQELLPQLAGQQHFFYVVSQEDLAARYPTLNLHVFHSKQTVAKAVLKTVRKEPRAQFVFHGQFNFPLWFAILRGTLPASRCYWHVWGADLYEDSTAWKFKMMYPARRMAQNKLPVLWATKGDLAFAKRHLRRETQQDRVLYFPTKMQTPLPALAEKTDKDGQLTLLLGNSGDPSNRHLDALLHIKQTLGENVRLIVPMGYPANNQAYITQVRQQAVKLFPENAIEILADPIDFTHYLDILAACDVGYFNFERQQGIGTLCLLTQLNIPTVLHRRNPFGLDMQQARVPFIYTDELNAAAIEQARQQLHALDKSKIGFFAPNYTAQWLTLLTEVHGKH